jgi:O-antigen/teichoic acid export membrane protein
MNAEAIVAVSAAVVALVQIIKWSGLPDKWGPVVVLVASLLGVAVWAYSRGDFSRAEAFGYFAGWIAVSLNAAGIFGFTRAAASAVVSAVPPPVSGAGSSPTKKD